MKQPFNLNKIQIFDEKLSDVYALTSCLFIAVYKRSPIYSAFATV